MINLDQVLEEDENIKVIDIQNNFKSDKMEEFTYRQHNLLEKEHSNQSETKYSYLNEQTSEIINLNDKIFIDE